MEAGPRPVCGAGRRVCTSNKRTSVMVAGISCMISCRRSINASVTARTAVASALSRARSVRCTATVETSCAGTGGFPDRAPTGMRAASSAGYLIFMAAAWAMGRNRTLPSAPALNGWIADYPYAKEGVRVSAEKSSRPRPDHLHRQIGSPRDADQNVLPRGERIETVLHLCQPNPAAL